VLDVELEAKGATLLLLATEKAFSYLQDAFITTGAPIFLPFPEQ
jgi:hypothetical protein